MIIINDDYYDKIIMMLSIISKKLYFLGPGNFVDCFFGCNMDS